MEGLRRDPASAGGRLKQQAWLWATPTGRSQNRQEGAGKHGLLPLHVGPAAQPLFLQRPLLLPARRSLGAALYQILTESRNPHPSASQPRGEREL